MLKQYEIPASGPKIIKNLKDIDYELFRMKYWDEYSVREIIEYYSPLKC